MHRLLLAVAALACAAFALVPSPRGAPVVLYDQQLYYPGIDTGALEPYGGTIHTTLAGCAAADDCFAFGDDAGEVDTFDVTTDTLYTTLTGSDISGFGGTEYVALEWTATRHFDLNCTCAGVPQSTPCPSYSIFYGEQIMWTWKGFVRYVYQGGAYTIDEPIQFLHGGTEWKNYMPRTFPYHVDQWSQTARVAGAPVVWDGNSWEPPEAVEVWQDRWHSTWEIAIQNTAQAAQCAWRAFAMQFWWHRVQIRTQ